MVKRWIWALVALLVFGTGIAAVALLVDEPTVSLGTAYLAGSLVFGGAR